MRLDSDDFELFGLPRRFAQDAAAVDARWRALQAEVHPDRFAAQGTASQRVAMQWAVRVNEAYRRLKDPLRRAAYLCKLGGADIEAENNTAMPAAFLAEQMHWREALDEARTLDEVQVIAREVGDRREAGFAELGRALDENHDFAAAAQRVKALMFIERMADEIDRRLEALGQ
jgi:molecular chaperone HscB